MNRYEEAFLQATGDVYCIYQLKLTDETARWLFMSSDYLREHDMEPAYEDYDAVYSGDLPENIDSRTKTLDVLFMKFNEDRPQDFTYRRLSVSDIIALKRGTLMSAHYVDSVGFTSVPDFMARKLMEAAAEEGHTSDQAARSTYENRMGEDRCRGRHQRRADNHLQQSQVSGICDTEP